jgi:hypothetical protein
MFFRLFLFLTIFSGAKSLLFSQNNIVTYAGNAGKETFYDVTALSDGTFLVGGSASNLDWVPANVPKTLLTSANISNAQGTGLTGFIMQLSPDLQQILRVLHFPPNVVENVRFFRLTNLLGQSTGDIFFSCDTKDTRANGGGYAICKLNNNFVNGVPTALTWVYNVWAEGVVKENHPWDVGNDGKVIFLTGQTHANDWAQAARLNTLGQREIVPNWRTHWIANNGGEFKGLSTSYSGSVPLEYSGIVFKRSGRCDLRSWTMADYTFTQQDENGGTKVGKWPLDAFYNGPCDPAAPTAVSPGYTGYSMASQVYGPSVVTIDRKNNDFYIGMNVKSTLPDGLPDFEPSVFAMDKDGSLKWWTRLYHEIQPDGDTVNSTPDQYIDALAIDYKNNQLVINARAHGNNVENFWEGNTIAANPNASGFQNQFTGSSGNIHLSWLGKFDLLDGKLRHSTYVGEYAEGATGLGTPHPDPNMDGWPNPNAGWPTLNTTRLGRNALDVAADGSVVVLGVGRRTMTTKNAYQKMIKPGTAGKSAWNSFVRAYPTDLSAPLYSSLVVGVWDTLTEMGGGNTMLFGAVKVQDGIIAVGKTQADANNVASGNALPVINVPTWGNAVPQGESAILVYYKATNLENTADNPMVGVSQVVCKPNIYLPIKIVPNPNNGNFRLSSLPENILKVELLNLNGQLLKTWNHVNASTNFTTSGLVSGVYLLRMTDEWGRSRVEKLVVE